MGCLAGPTAKWRACRSSSSGMRGLPGIVAAAVWIVAVVVGWVDVVVMERVVALVGLAFVEGCCGMAVVVGFVGVVRRWVVFDS